MSKERKSLWGSCPEIVGRFYRHDDHVHVGMDPGDFQADIENLNTKPDCAIDLANFLAQSRPLDPDEVMFFMDIIAKQDSETRNKAYAIVHKSFGNQFDKRASKELKGAVKGAGFDMSEMLANSPAIAELFKDIPTGELERINKQMEAIVGKVGIGESSAGGIPPTLDSTPLAQFMAQGNKLLTEEEIEPIVTPYLEEIEEPILKGTFFRYLGARFKNTPEMEALVRAAAIDYELAQVLYSHSVVGMRQFIKYGVTELTNFISYRQRELEEAHPKIMDWVIDETMKSREVGS